MPTIIQRVGLGRNLTAAEVDTNFMNTKTELEAATAAIAAAVVSIALKAPLADAPLTGNPTAPTQTAGNNSTRLANTAFVQAAIATLIASAPGALDTLNELALALGSDANFSATVTNALALKAPLASPALSGVPTAPTATLGTNTTQVSTTAFVQAAVAALVASAPGTLDTLNELAAALGSDPNFATTMATSLALKAPLASPALTGVPLAPTAAAGTNTTQIATAAHVFAERANALTLTNKTINGANNALAVRIADLSDTSAYVKTLLDDADAGAARVTLGLGGGAAVSSVFKPYAQSGVMITGAAGAATEEQLASISLPALGANAQVLLTTKWRKTGTAGTCTLAVKLGGTTMQSVLTTNSNITADFDTQISNQNNAAVQRGMSNSVANGGLGSSGATSGTINTAVAGVALTIHGTRANVGDALDLISYRVLIYDPDAVTLSAAISGFFADSHTMPANAQTGTTYAFADGDRGKFVELNNASSVAASIAQAGAASQFLADWYTIIKNTGAGTVTLTPTTSTVNGAATLVLTTGQGAIMVSDGTNYKALVIGQGGSSSVDSTVQTLANASTTNWNRASGAIARLAAVTIGDAIAAPTNFTAGQKGTLLIQCGVVPLWNAAYDFGDAGLPDLLFSGNGATRAVLIEVLRVDLNATGAKYRCAYGGTYLW